MKFKRIILTILVLVIIVSAVTVRLISNKQSFKKQLQMASESNTVIPVLTDTVKSQAYTPAFSVNGNFLPMREITVTSEIQGKVVSLAADIGDKVRSGQILVTVDHELYSAQLEQAKFNLEKAKKDLERFEQLSRDDAATVQQYESARQAFINARVAQINARLQYDHTFIRAPFQGIINKRHIEKGTYLMTGMPVFDISEIDNVKFMAKLTAKQTNMIRKGLKVEIRAETYPDVLYEGRISAISVQADPSRRYDAEVIVKNRYEHLIKPGIWGAATFRSPNTQNILIIPRKAVSGSIQTPEVFIVRGDSAELRPIQAVPLNDKELMVTKGLQEGEVLVVSGQINLVDGSKISVNK